MGLQSATALSAQWCGSYPAKARQAIYITGKRLMQEANCCRAVMPFGQRAVVLSCCHDSTKRFYFSLGAINSVKTRLRVAPRLKSHIKYASERMKISFFDKVTP